MPFIDARISKKLTDEEIINLKADLGKAIAVFPGKSESWLMVNIEDGKKMFFKGSDEDCAFAEVKLFGSADASFSDKFTARFCDFMENLGISPDRVYVRYEGGNLWGWNGANF